MRLVLGARLESARIESADNGFIGSMEMLSDFLAKSSLNNWDEIKSESSKLEVGNGEHDLGIGDDGLCSNPISGVIILSFSFWASSSNNFPGIYRIFRKTPQTGGDEFPTGSQDLLPGWCIIGRKKCRQAICHSISKRQKIFIEVPLVLNFALHCLKETMSESFWNGHRLVLQVLPGKLSGSLARLLQVATLRTGCSPGEGTGRAVLVTTVTRKLSRAR